MADGELKAARDSGAGTAQAKKGKDDTLNLSSQPLPAGPPSSVLHAGIYKLSLSSTSLTALAFLESTPSLSLLNLSGNPTLGSLSDSAWAQALSPLQGLCVLNLGRCELTEVPKVIGRLAKLKALVLGENRIQEIEAVKGLPELNTLVVSHNRIQVLPSSLTTLPSLKKLSATHNEFTVASLPDLSPLPNLREARLAGNPGLNTLPPHLATWGTSKGGKGLEILELGSCGLRRWADLEPLQSMTSLRQLTLHGNQVAASSDENFEVYKSKVTQLVPSLRILDGHRFDPRFLAAKKGGRPAADQPHPPDSPKSHTPSKRPSSAVEPDDQRDDKRPKRPRRSEPQAERGPSGQERSEAQRRTTEAGDDSLIDGRLEARDTTDKPPPNPATAKMKWSQTERLARKGNPDAQDSGTGKSQAKKGKDDALDLSSQSFPKGPPSSVLHAGICKLTLSSTSLRTVAFLKSTPSLSWLDLSGNPALGKLSDAVWAEVLSPLEGLRALNLGRCELKKVPKVVGRLAKLEALLLGENQIPRVDVVKSLPKLSMLVVSHNRIQILPSSLRTLSSLEELSATHNELTTAGLADLSPLADLHEARLAGNPGLDTLPPHLATWGTSNGGKGLEVLELGSCGLRRWADLEPLRNMTSLHYLTLRGNQVTASDDANFEVYKSKVTQLVPSLKILDGHCFDPEFLAAKTAGRSAVDQPRPPDSPKSHLPSKRPSSATEPDNQRTNRGSKRRRQSEPQAPREPSEQERLEARMRKAEADAEADGDDLIDERSEPGDTAAKPPPNLPMSAAAEMRRAQLERMAGKGNLKSQRTLERLALEDSLALKAREARMAEAEASLPGSIEDTDLPEESKQKGARYKAPTLGDAAVLGAQQGGASRAEAPKELVQARDPSLYAEGYLARASASRGSEKQQERIDERRRSSVVEVVAIAARSKWCRDRYGKKDKATQQDAVAALFQGQSVAEGGLGVGGWD